MKLMGILGIIGMGLGIVFLITLILSLPILWLWNWLCPDIFGLPEITWLQAWGLGILGNLLFGGVTSSSSNSKKQ